MKGGKISVDPEYKFSKFKGDPNQPKRFLEGQNKYLQRLSIIIPKLVNKMSVKSQPWRDEVKKVINELVGLQINYLANIVNYVEANPTTGGKRKKQRSRSKHR